MKNNIMHNAIPEHSEASVATANGNANITAIVTAIQVMITLRLSISKISYRYTIYAPHSFNESGGKSKKKN